MIGVALPLLATLVHPGVSDLLVDVEAFGMRPTGEVLLRLVDEAELPDDPRIVGFTRLPGTGAVHRLRPTPEVDPATLARELKALPQVLWSLPDLVLPVAPVGGSNDTYWDTLWHLDNTAHYPRSVAGADVGAVGAWELSTGEGALIAIIDTGVDLTHPDLEVLAGWDYVDGDDDPSPVVGSSGYAHGTGMAGLAGAIGHNGIGVVGVARDAQLLAVRLVGGETTLGDVYAAFVSSVDAGASVLSNSWSMSAQSCDDLPVFALLDEAIEYAETEGRGGRGAAVVFGSGNIGCDISGDTLIGNPRVVGVGASDDRDRLFGYSNYGDHIDVVAPSGPSSGGDGQYLRSTDIVGPDGYPGFGDQQEYTDTLWGTSGSTPLVSGVLALMFSLDSELSAAEAREILCSSAVPIDPEVAGYDRKGWSPRAGCGRVDAEAALLAVQARETGDDDDDSSTDDDDSSADDDSSSDEGSASYDRGQPPPGGCACGAGHDMPFVGSLGFLSLGLGLFAVRWRRCAGDRPLL